MNRNTWLAVLGAALIAGAYLLVFRKSDEGKIRAQLGALSAAVHVEAGENQLLRAKRIQDTFARVFAVEVPIDVPGLHEGPEQRARLVALAVGAGAQYRTVDLRFDRVTVELEKPQRRAWVTSTARVSGTARDGGEQAESREVVMRFVESEGEWRITSVAIAGSDAR